LWRSVGATGEETIDRKPIILLLSFCRAHHSTAHEERKPMIYIYYYNIINKATIIV
jgi:hypothetical protein